MSFVATIDVQDDEEVIIVTDKDELTLIEEGPSLQGTVNIMQIKIHNQKYKFSS